MSLAFTILFEFPNSPAFISTESKSSRDFHPVGKEEMTVRRETATVPYIRGGIRTEPSRTFKLECQAVITKGTTAVSATSSKKVYLSAACTTPLNFILQYNIPEFSHEDYALCKGHGPYSRSINQILAFFYSLLQSTVSNMMTRCFCVCL